MNSVNKLVLTMVLLGVILLPTAFATYVDVSIALTKLVYEADDDVNITGFVTTVPPNATAVPNMPVVVNVTNSSGALVFQNTTNTSSNGIYYTPSVYTPTETGTYSITVYAFNSTHNGTAHGSFDVEPERIFSLTTDKFTYSTNETVTVTLTVLELSGDGSDIPVSGESVNIQIKREDGTIVHAATVVTGADGTATTQYTIPVSASSYATYTVIADGGRTFTTFDVPSFNIAVELQGADNEVKNIFASNDQIKVRSIASITSDSGGVIPVSDAVVSATLKNPAGTTFATWTSANFTESNDGTYDSTLLYLNSTNVVSGDYYVEVQVTKSGLTQTKKAWFEIKNLRLDIMPYSSMPNINGFLKNRNVSLGLVVFDLRTGEKIDGQQLTAATITSCKDNNNQNCMGELSNTGTLITVDKPEFTRALVFTAMNRTGNFIFEIEVNTSTGSSVRGDVAITVQNILAYTETTDQYGGLRKDFAPGEVVIFLSHAVTGEWEDVTQNITSVSLVEVRDSNWNLVTGQFSATTYNATKNKLSLAWSNTSVSQPTGWYNVKIQVNSTLGTAYARGNFMTKKFNTMIEPRDADGYWQWQFSSTDTIFFYFEVMELSGQALDADEYVASLQSITNELTGQVFTTATAVNNGTSVSGKKIMKVDLSSLGASSGIYRANFKITDLSGNVDYANTWFKISSLNMWVVTKLGTQERNDFAPTNNITLEIHANYFNGTAIPSGSNATVEALMYIEQGPPTPIPASLYDSSGTVDLVSGIGTLWVKASSGNSFSQGDYLAMIRVYANDSSNTTDITEGWFRVSVLSVGANANPQTIGVGQNVTITVTVTQTDGTPVNNASISLDGVFNQDTWTLEPSITGPTYFTDSTGSGSYTFSSSGLSTGRYMADLFIQSTTLGARTKIGVPFTVRDYQIGGFLNDPSQTVYSSGTNVQYNVYVNYSNGTAASGLTVSIYKLVNTDGWPWDYVDATTRVTGTTDSSGSAQVTVQAPTSSGIYYPLVQLITPANETYNSTDIFALQPFEVKSLKVQLSLYDNMTKTTVFQLNDTIKVSFNVTSPGGGVVSLNSVTLVSYRTLATNVETELGTRRTTNLGSRVNMSFAAPSSSGEYILTTQVEDNSTGDIITQDVWFKVESINYIINTWMTQWQYSKNTATAVNVEAWTDSGADATVMVDGIQIRDPWTNTEIESDGNLSVQNVTGSGYYNFTTPNQTGEFELELCFYPVGYTCTEDSERRYVHFSVATFDAWVWPTQPSYTQDQIVDIRVEVPGAPSAAEFETDFIGLYKMPNQVDVTTSITVPPGQNVGLQKVLNFSASNLTTGDYMARINVSMNNDAKIVSVWFTVSDYTLEIDTIPSSMYSDRRFFVGENITFNFSMGSNVSGENLTGTWELRTDFTWQLVDNGSFTITEGNSETYENIMVNSNGQYNLEARLGSAMDFFWFQAGAYRVDINHAQSTHDVPIDDNVTVAFNVYYPNGSEYTGNVTFQVLRLRNVWNWQIVEGTENLFNTTMSAGGGTETVSFNHNQTQSGEFEAELRITIDDKNTDQFFWFRTVSKQFWVWPRSPTYSPGDTVYLQAFLAYANNTPMQGVDVNIMQVVNTWTWQPVNITTWINRTNSTGSNGETIVSFVMPESAGNGEFEIKLNESDAGDITFTRVQVSGYHFNFQRHDWKWSYVPGENLSGDLYVFDSSFLPKADIVVNVTVYNQQDWETPVAQYGMGTTDANGHFLVSWPVGSNTGEFRAQISIANGALWFDEWYSVDALSVTTVARGETSSTSTVSSNETVILTVTAKYPNGTRIEGADVSFYDLKNLNGWIDTNFTAITDDQVTDSNGRAQLKFSAPTTYGDFIIRSNVTSGSNEVITEDGWFRVSQYSTTVSLACPPESGSNCDPVLRSPDSEIIATVTLEGAQTDDEVCLRKIHSISRGWDQFYDQCYPFQSGNETFNLTFMAPFEAGEYNAVFEFKDQNGMWIDEKWIYFRVLGGSGYNFNMWVEPRNAWPGRNATINVEIWDITSWFDIIELDLCSNISIQYIRNSETGEIVNQTVTQDVQQGSGFDGPPSARLTFTLPPDLIPGEYSARVLGDDCGGTNLTGDAFFRATAFQASSLMSEQLRMNTNTSFWVKVTNATGGPIVNATLSQNSLVDQWSWDEVQTYNTTYLTDENGEITGVFITPNYPGEFILKLEVDDGSETQVIDRKFRIQQLIVDLDFGGQEVFFEGDTVTLNVLVRDAVTGLPVGNANVNLDVMKHEFIDGGAVQEPEEPVDCHQYGEENSCWNVSECAWFDDGYAASCRMAGEYTCFSNFTTDPLCNEDPQCWWDSYDQSCRFDMGAAGGGMNTGANMYNAVTTYDGVATFIFTGQTALAAGEYEVNANVNTMNGGWAWSHKSFTVKLWDVTLTTDKFYYSPGETIQLNLTANYTNGTALPDSTEIFAGLEAMDFSKAGDACFAYWNETECTNDANCQWIIDEGPPFCDMAESSMDETNTSLTSGLAQFNLSIPSNASAGPTIIFVDVENLVTNETDFLDYVVIVTSANATYNITNLGNVSPGTLFEVNITSTKSELALAPFVQHLEKTGNAVSMSQLMGGGPESGKEDNYDSPIYFTENNNVHYSMLARDRKACYVGLHPVLLQGTDWNMATMAFEDVLLVSYCVNSSTGECRQDYQCNDQNSSTADYCVFFECENYDVSTLDCQYDYECNNVSNEGTIEVCWQGSCMTVESSECEFDWECDDFNSQTIDRCMNYQCEYQNSSSVECFSDFDCNDDEPSTANICEFGICVYPDSNNIVCTQDVQCNDGNASTYDWCDRSVYQCINEDSSNFECTNNYDCNDADSSTVDLCMNGWCQNQPASNFECTQDADCDDDNPSTYDFCDDWSYFCIHTSGSECTPETVTTTCTDKNESQIALCWDGWCEYIDNSSVECYSESDCDDGNETTQNFCMNFVCQYGMGDCMMDSECSDGNASTIDVCDMGFCKFYSTSQLNWYVDWTQIGNLPGVNFTMNGPEMADEQNPWGNPSADIIGAKMTNDTTYLYAQMKTGPMKDLFGGLPQCGGNLRSGLSYQWYELYVNTTEGSGSDEANFTDMDHKFRLNVTASNKTLQIFDWSSGWTTVSNGAAYKLECKTSTIDFRIPLVNVSVTNQTLQSIFAIWTSMGLSDRAPNDAGLFDYSMVNGSSGSNESNETTDGNDYFADAVLLTFAQPINATLNVEFNDTFDYYMVNATAGVMLLGEIIVENATNDFDAYLYNSSYELMNWANDTGQYDSFTSMGLEFPGIYYIMVTLKNGYGTYILNVTNISAGPGGMSVIGNDTDESAVLDSVNIIELSAGMSPGMIMTRMTVENLTTNLTLCGGLWSGDQDTAFEYQAEFDTQPGGYYFSSDARNGTDYAIRYVINGTTNWTAFYYFNQTHMIENVTVSPNVFTSLGCGLDQVELGINYSYLNLLGNETINISFWASMNATGAWQDYAPNESYPPYEFTLGGGG